MIIIASKEGHEEVAKLLIEVHSVEQLNEILKLGNFRYLKSFIINKKIPFSCTR